MIAAVEAGGRKAVAAVGGRVEGSLAGEGSPEVVVGRSLVEEEDHILGEEGHILGEEEGTAAHRSLVGEGVRRSLVEGVVLHSLVVVVVEEAVGSLAAVTAHHSFVAAGGDSCAAAGGSLGDYSSLGAGQWGVRRR